MRRMARPRQKPSVLSDVAPAALGFRAHSGWTALVVVVGPRHSPTVVERRRIELIATGIPKQPYHAAEKLDLKAAEKLIGRSVEAARRLARQAVRAVIADLRDKGHEAVGSGIVLASGRPATTLAATLASHALIHTAEGELFRSALAYASEQCGLPVLGVRERDLHDRCATDLHIEPGELGRRISEMGRRLGPPWTQDQKQAALIGWLVLAAA